MTRGDARPEPMFEELFGALLPRLYRRAVLLTGRADLAEECVRRAHHRLVARPHRLLSHPEPYAHALAALLRAVRGARPRGRHLGAAARPDGPGGPPEAVRLLGSLPLPQAAAVVLVDLDGRTSDEAAEILRVHRATVTRCRDRALERLGPALTPAPDAFGAAERRAGVPAREARAERLRALLHAADQELTVPARLTRRVSAGPPAAPARRRRWAAAAGRRGVVGVVGVVLCGLAAVLAGAWWLGRPQPADPAEAPAVVPLTVYNVEVPCQPLRTQECALGLARDPRMPYRADGNRAGQVWHGERLAAHCVIPDGQLITDETGMSSARWYLVAQESGERGWLPGVRTRNTVEVRRCTPAESGALPVEQTP